MPFDENALDAMIDDAVGEDTKEVNANADVGNAPVVDEPVVSEANASPVVEDIQAPNLETLTSPVEEEEVKPVDTPVTDQDDDYDDDGLTGEEIERGIKAGFRYDELVNTTDPSFAIKAIEREEVRNGTAPKPDKPVANDEPVAPVFDTSAVDDAFTQASESLSNAGVSSYDEDGNPVDILAGLKGVVSQLSSAIVAQNSTIAELKSANSESVYNNEFSKKEYANIPDDQRAAVIGKTKILLAGSKALGNEVDMASAFKDAVNMVVPADIISGKRERVSGVRKKRSRHVVVRGTNNSGALKRPKEPATLDEAIDQLMSESDA
jgi:hypothetical protein